MLDEKATWNSFSGSLKKIEKDLISMPSIRGKRYFGPSQMSFFNLLKHSLSIISVFRKTVLIRSALFIIFYILLNQKLRFSNYFITISFVINNDLFNF